MILKPKPKNFPIAVLIRLSQAQLDKARALGGHRGVSRWIKSLIDSAG